MAEADPARALDRLTRCLACPTARPAAFLLAADLHRTAGDFETAFSVLLRATTLYPLSASLWEARARQALALGRSTAALDAMATAHRLRPEDGRLAAAYRSLLTRFGSGADRRSAEVDALLLEAEGRYELDDIAGAKSTLNEALAKANSMPRRRAKVYLRLGLIALVQGDLDEAKAALQAALSSEHNDRMLTSAIHLARAELGLAKGDYAFALSAAEAAVASRPRDPLNHVNLALARAHLRDFAGAVFALESAVKLGIANQLARTDLERLLDSAPWGGERPRVARLIDEAWR